MRGLEIGALHNPRLPVGHRNSYFVDRATADELRVKYAEDPAMTAHTAEIVDVDYVWRPGTRLRDAVGADAPFDFVVASHLIEHIPNPIGWFQQVAEILRPGGIISLVVPDKRFCFDARRDVTRCLALSSQTEFIDVHCSTFTPESFVDLFDTAVRLGLVPFEILEVFPTEPHSLEFHVSLAHRRDPIPTQRRTQRTPARRTPPSTDTHHTVSLSPREMRLIMAKRTVMKAIRSLGRGRTRSPD